MKKLSKIKLSLDKLVGKQVRYQVRANRKNYYTDGTLLEVKLGVGRVVGLIQWEDGTTEWKSELKG